ncbi:hypothetical protein WJ542_26605 [Paraburkholderia sp. B3]|uniref:hypothetical protein n=1 Tax=Paraburkholderia sp. B3 TaxID=3134791 RepID=UPI003982132F
MDNGSAIDDRPEPIYRRETILVEVDNPADVTEAEAWLEAAADRLFFVSEQKGCGCCVLSWDIEGPAELLDTLPDAFRCDSGWTRREDQPQPAPGLLRRWQSSRIYQGHALSALLLIGGVVMLLMDFFRFLLR